MKQTPNKASESENETSRTTYQKVVFGIAFLLIFLESAFLISTVQWESAAPNLLKKVIDNRAQLLAVAAAVTALLSLMLSWNPKGIEKFATLGSGLLGLTAASFSIEIEQWITGLALYSLVFPLWITILPVLKWPENLRGVITFFLTAGHITLINLALILLVELLTKVAFWAGARDFVDVTAMSIVIAFYVTLVIIFVQLIAKFLVDTKIIAWMEKVIQKISNYRQHETRAERRRGNRKSRKSRKK